MFVSLCKYIENIKKFKKIIFSKDSWAPLDTIILSRVLKLIPRPFKFLYTSPFFLLAPLTNWIAQYLANFCNGCQFPNCLGHVQSDYASHSTRIPTPNPMPIPSWEQCECEMFLPPKTFREWFACLWRSDRNRYKTEFLVEERTELVQSNRNHLAEAKRSWESVQYNLHAQILKLQRECGSSQRSEGRGAPFVN